MADWLWPANYSVVLQLSADVADMHETGLTLTCC